MLYVESRVTYVRVTNELGLRGLKDSPGSFNFIPEASYAAEHRISTFRRVPVSSRAVRYISHQSAFS